MLVTLGDQCPSYPTVKNWVGRFRTGRMSTEVKEHSGRPTQVTVPENP
jgi:transposase